MPNFPIVLAHGIARFDILLQRLQERLPETDFGDLFHYFKGIKSHLHANGFQVFAPNQAFAGPVDLRASQLRDRVNEALGATGAEKVHIIAHSMGGLDARHMIVDKGMAERVASLTTIGTPHLGTVLADHMIDHGGFLLKQALRQIINLDGFDDLRVDTCGQFNSRAEHHEATNNVTYQTFASAEEFHLVFAPLMPSWKFIHDRDGKNDGLVSITSQSWKNELVATDGRRKAIIQKEFPIAADHLNQVGWWDLQEAAATPKKFFQSFIKPRKNFESRVKDFYLQIAQGLRDL